MDPLTKTLLTTTDGMVWAEEFCKLYRSGIEIDEGLMVGWFANAIEVGRDAGRRASAETAVAQPAEQAADIIRDTGA